MRARTQHRKVRSAGVFAAILLALPLGAASAFLTTDTAVAVETCEKKACDTDYNFCSSTDLEYRCEKGNPCRSVACEEVET